MKGKSSSSALCRLQAIRVVRRRSCSHEADAKTVHVDEGCASALSVFSVMSGILSATHAGEGQPAQSGATAQNEKMHTRGWRLLQGWGHDAPDRVGEASAKRTIA